MIVLSNRTDDLGGKILNYFASYCLAQKLGVAVEVYWLGEIQKRDGALHVMAESNPYKIRFVKRLQTYFSNVHFLSTESLQQRIRGSSFCYVDTYEDLDDALQLPELCVVKGQLDVLGEERAVEAHRYGDLFLDVATAFDDFFYIHLGLPQSLIHRVYRIANKMPLEQAVGIHIRQGDCKIMKDRLKSGELRGVDEMEARRSARRCISIKDYERSLRHFKGFRIFVCSDDPSIKGHFAKQYPQACIAYQVRSYDRLNLCGKSLLSKCLQLVNFRKIPKGIEDTLIDMILLSKCRYIIRGSSLFAKVSTMLNSHYLEIEDGAILVDNIWGTERRFPSRRAAHISNEEATLMEVSLKVH